MGREEILARQRALLELARSEGRAMTAEELSEFDSLQRALEALDARQAAPPVPSAAPAAAPQAGEPSARAAVEAERARVREITDMCREFNMDCRSYIDDGSSVEAVRAALIEHIRANRAPLRTPVQVEAAEEDKFRAAAVDGLLMRSGITPAAPADGANDFRGISLRDLAIECLEREGVTVGTGKLTRASADDLYGALCRQFYNPSSSFPAIMDQTIRKGIVDAYNKVPTTFERFTTKGTLQDFKESPDHEYVIGGVGDFEKVPEGGEIHADKPSTAMLPTRKLDTYGKQFSMTRQAFINDDIGFLTQVPGMYAAAAKKTIDKQVFGTIYNNSVIYDGVVLFHSSHKNVAAVDSAPTQAAIQAMIMLLQKQTDQFDDAIYVTPKTIVVPIGYGFDLNVIFHSAQVTGSSNNDYNPLFNYPLEIVESPVLNALAGAGKCPWFLVADPSSAKSIQVDYLNGQETPTIRRMETPGTLGFVWDVYLDWGVSVRDFRGIVKNGGAILA